MLKPLHDWLMILLQHPFLKDNDGTFHQGKVFTFYDEIIKLNKPMYSIDLSAATDRLPLSLQSRLLRLITGSENLGKR